MASNDVHRRLAGRYELAEIIGRGGMGAVYRATDLVLDRTVAVKLLPAALAEQDRRHVARFEREARAAASLTHPGVVAVYDAGEDGDTRFIVMEFVSGRSLSRVLREEAPLEPARAASIAAGVAGALAAAHAAGIVHRDVKPGNVMLTDDGEVKVLDFGIARALDGHTLTHSTSVLGTARYMAPEQALGRRADARSDIYALGCVVYAMLTGHPPFTADAPAAVIHQHVNSEPVPPSELNHSVPPAFDALVMKMLVKSPAARPQDASLLRDQLGRAADGSAAHQDATAATVRMPPGQQPGSRRRRRAAAAAMTAAAVLTTAALAFSLGGGSRRQPTRGRASSSASPAATQDGGRAAQSARTSTRAAAPAPSPGSSPAPTVAGAADALTSLIAQELQSGAIDLRAARRLGDGLAKVVGAYAAGQRLAAQRAAAELSKKLAALQADGEISASAATPLNAALAGLSSALAASPLQTAQQTAAAEGRQETPGHGHGAGKAKKHGSHAEGEGD